MNDELKPCPFCGGEAMLFDAVGEMWACCKTCLASSRMHSDPIKAAAAWNSRAAVTDEQFAIAVHDGEAWQRVRECRNIGCETGDDFKCSACGEAYNESDDMAMPASRIDWCFSCVAKVVG